MNFLKSVLASVLGVFIAFWLFLFFIIGLAAAMGSSSDTKIKKNSILTLNLTEEIKDFGGKVLFDEFGFEETNNKGLNFVIKAIKKAKDDDKIKGIQLKSFSGIGSLAQLMEVRKALEDFKTSGKFIYTYLQSETTSQKDYFIHSLADSVFVSPASRFIFQGFGTNILYDKKLKDKVGFKHEVYRYGKFKSAVETYLTDKMSDENRQQLTEMLASLWEVYAREISKSRNISTEKLNEIANNLSARRPQNAHELGLIDGVLYQDEFDEILCKATQTEKPSDLEYISVMDYIKKMNEMAILEKQHDDKIAVISAEGVIMSGKSTPFTIGDETIIEALREIRENDDIKAIVLRINSPGGSASASEKIHREIEITKKIKPIYASMANVAASGGYYIACNTDRIFANEQTITGSVGIYMAIPNFAGLLDLAKVNNEQVSTHKFGAGLYNGLHIFENSSQETQKILSEEIEEGYKLFVQRVSDGRKLSWDDTHSVAQGRVWTGKQALENGLVDEIATLNEVLDYAATQNNLTEYSVVSYPVIKVSLEDIFAEKLPFLSVKNILKKEFGEASAKLYEELKNLNQQEEGLQAKMPYQIRIE